MADFSINEMQEMQKTLQDKYKHKWEPIGPETGKNKILWMIGEIGEVVDIVKKHEGTKASTDVYLRKELVEEISNTVSVVEERDYYSKVKERKCMKLMTKISMTVSDAFHMVKMVHLKLN